MSSQHLEPRGTNVAGVLFVRLARTRFGLGMAPVGVAAGWNGSLEGRCVFPRKGGARLYLMNGMAREATRELGG